MKRVHYIGKFNASFGLTFIIKYETDISVGQSVIIDDTEYVVKKIKMQSSPNKEKLIAVFV